MKATTTLLVALALLLSVAAHAQVTNVTAVTSGDSLVFHVTKDPARPKNLPFGVNALIATTFQADGSYGFTMFTPEANRCTGSPVMELHDAVGALVATFQARYYADSAVFAVPLSALGMSPNYGLMPVLRGFVATAIRLPPAVDWAFQGSVPDAECEGGKEVTFTGRTTTPITFTTYKNAVQRR